LWGKDLNADARMDIVCPNDVVGMVDVDYYIEDLPGWLADKGVPAMFYTFQPSEVASEVGNASHTFLEDGTVKYSVSGGGKYNHMLWNFSGDSFAHTERVWGWPVRHSVFALERKRVDEHHSVILAVPMGSFTGPVTAALASWRLKAAPLQRLEVRDSGFARLEVHTENGVKVSTARLGHYLSANVPAAVDNAIELAAWQLKLTHATVVSKMVGSGKCATSEGSEALHAYWLARTGKLELKPRKQLEQVFVMDDLHSYQYTLTLLNYEVGKPSMVQFMKPLVDAAYAAERTVENDKRAVEKRVKQPQERAAKVKGPDPFVRLCMQEFVSKLVEVIGSELRPVDYETVYDKQGRAKQRADLEESEHRHDEHSASAMQKAEAYDGPNDPRNITVIHPVSKREYSKFMYALYAAMAEVPWYAFGKKPVDIANAMAGLCEKATKWWADTDFSRQDGHVHFATRLLEQLVMNGVFAKEFHDEIKQLLRSQTFLNVRTRFGVRYNSGWSRASGSAETAVFNTLLTAFICFLGWRMTRKPEGFYDKHEAWEMLGLYGGDDGGTPDLDPKMAEKAAAAMAQKLEIVIVPKWEPGVQFLARHYGPGVWSGDANSCCDVRRQLSKFHVTTHLNKVTEVGKLLEKCFAFSLCDSETPVIGEFVKSVLIQYVIETGSHYQYINALNIWNSDIEKRSHYPNAYAEWMDELIDRQFEGQLDRGALGTWLGLRPSLDGYRNPPCLFSPPPGERKPDGVLVTDGEIVPEKREQPPPSESKPADGPKHRRAERKEHVRGNGTRRPPNDNPTRGGRKPKSDKDWVRNPPNSHEDLQTRSGQIVAQRPAMVQRKQKSHK
jgi:hypothetical protein